MIRSAYPDELNRAQSLLNGHSVPPSASFHVVVKEQPIERIIAAIPWWKVADENETEQLTFSFHSGNSSGLTEETLDELFTSIEALAITEKTSVVILDIALTEQHPLYKKLITRGYQIHKTETFISAPGDEVKSFFLNQKNELLSLPAGWSIQSIRGCAPESFYPLVSAEGSLTPKTFQAYWDGANRERFEGDLSHLVLAGEEVIGVLLASLQGSHGMNIRIESISPDYKDQAERISKALHQATLNNCPEGFPQVITWSRQTQSSYQDGKAQEPRHTLSKKCATCLQ